MAKKKTKPTSPKKPVTKLKFWHYLLLVAWPAIIFGRVITFGFVMHDDDKMILENPMVKQGIKPGIAFTTDAWFMDARIELYRPWQSITYMIDYALGKDKPFIYHVHNLIIFILGAFLLFVFLKNYFKPILAWAGAMLYSMNLLTPHATGWIAARGDLYLMVFGLLFLILLQRYLKSGSSVSLWIAVPVFFLALCSKESAVALLPVAGVMLYVERGKMPSAKEWLWMALNGIAFILYFFLRKGAIADAGNLSIKAFFSNLRSLGEELFKMVIPLGFSVMPGYSLIWTLGGIILIGLLIFLIRKYNPPKKILWAGAAIILFSLLPSMLYEPSFAGVAYDYLDHRSWFPYVGVWMMILGIIHQSKIADHKNAAILFGSVLVLWSGINFWRIGTYKGWETYYDNAIHTNPGSGLANLNYGSMLRDQGKWEEALPYIEKGVELSPNYTDAKVRLAEAYFNLKRYKDAVDIATEALKKEPKNVSALQFRGSAYGSGGQPAMAEQDFKAILEIDPTNDHAQFNLAMAYKDGNRLNEAIETLSKLITMKPDFPNAYFERGFCYGRMGLFPQAKADMDMSISYQPQHGASY
ncbi:MAG TPA: tetratricopeptide repeat protein, partial [Saprospiraceae bacterium]|nr:tetratricopeptide repeat protein [Saprospiraceae bacterium]